MTSYEAQKTYYTDKIMQNPQWSTAGIFADEGITMIYATGDTHGTFERFREEYFPEQATMTKDDYVIICGDFGGVWDGGKQENKRLDWLEQLPFTVLFVSGKHENFDLLAEYPVEDWNGGKVQRIRPHMNHLLRSQVFQL